jgi:Ni,Fe-hydrogenase I cytochrome b subunit
LDILPELTLADIAAIDAAGESGARHDAFIKAIHVMAGLMLLGALLFRVHAFVAKT